MEATDGFFSGSRYAIFGAAAAGRAHGSILIAALHKASKTAVAVQPDGTKVRGTECVKELTPEQAVDGAVILPPSPWSNSAADFTRQALAVCQQNGIAKVWIYPDGVTPQLNELVAASGIDAVVGICPCLHIANGGFPHNLHRWINRKFKRM